MLLANFTKAQLAVTINNNAQQLAQNIAGTGVTVSNAVLTCSDSGSAIIDGSTSNIGFNSGILLATGIATLAVGPNNVGGAGTWPNLNQFIDNDLSTILPGYDFYDGCVLEFDVVPLGNQISFSYVFGSEEYPEYVCSDFNDVFGFFISGPGIAGNQNIALIPGTSFPVTINNVNSGNVGSSSGCAFGIPCNGCRLNYDNYYVDNGLASVQYDGFTTVLSAQSVVIPCETYRLKLAIADAGDGVLDSGVFLEEGSLNSNIPVVTQATNDAFEGCRNGVVIFGIPNAVNNPTTINYVIAGTATNGLDYNQIPDSLVIPAGQTNAQIDIITIIDTTNDPIETIELYVFTLLCDTLFYDTVIITLREELPVLNAQDTIICLGEQVQLQVGGGITYQWAPPIGLNNPNIANPIFTGTATTGYIVSAIDSNNCRGRGFVSVYVIPPPDIQFTSNYTICLGDTVQLNVSGADNYTWLPNTSLSNISIPNPLSWPNSSIIYSVVGDTLGCADTVEVSINLNSPPIAFAGNDTAVCENTSINLNASGGNTYSWLPSNNLSDANIANPTFNVSTTTTFIVTVGNGCFDDDTVTITALSSLPISAGNDILKCAEDTVQLSATGGSNYIWTPDSNIINLNTANPSIFSTSNTLYFLNGLDSNGCNTSDSVWVSIIEPMPVNAGNDVFKCAEDTVQLSASGGSNYTWMPNSNMINANSANPSVFSISNTLYYLYASDSNGCNTSDSVLISIIDVGSFNAGNDTSICNGLSVLIGGNPTADSTAILAWTAINGDINSLSTLNAQNPFFNSNISDVGVFTYQVSGSEQGCDAGSDLVTIIVNAIPIANFLGLDSIYCLDDPESILLGSPSGGSFTGIGLVGNNFNPAIAGLGAFFEINYALTDENGCSDDTTQITQVTTYNVDAGEDQTIEIFDSIQLSPSNDAINYEWSPNETLSCADCINPFASPTVTTTYTLIAIDENGCVAQDSVTIEVFIDTLLWLPNAFTPDGDGVNDLFLVYGKNFKTIDFKVFNRWGELLFATNNPSQGWDGTYKNKEMNAGVYVFTIQATYINELESGLQRGSFVLVR